MNRYSRQTAFAGIGYDGQKKLLSSRVCIVGQGALGAYSSSFLARSGVGRLKLIDFDRVELSNLQRQNLFEQRDIGKPKAECAKSYLQLINPEIEIDAVCEKLTDENVRSLLGQAELVIDAVDNLDARECINRFCVENSIPWIYGGVAGSEGMTMNILPGHACFKCLMPGEAPRKEDCADAASRGIIGMIAPFISSIQCAEAIKILIYGPEHPDVRKTLVYADMFRNIYEQHEIRQLPGCMVCGRTGG